MTTHSSTDFSLVEAQHAMGVTPVRLEKLIEEGKVQVIREGFETWVPRQSILDYFEKVAPKKKK